MDIRTKFIDSSLAFVPRDITMIIGAYAIDIFECKSIYSNVINEFKTLITHGCSVPAHFWYYFECHRAYRRDDKKYQKYRGREALWKYPSGTSSSYKYMSFDEWLIHYES